MGSPSTQFIMTARSSIFVLALIGSVALVSGSRMLLDQQQQEDPQQLIDDVFAGSHVKDTQEAISQGSNIGKKHHHHSSNSNLGGINLGNHMLKIPKLKIPKIYDGIGPPVSTPFGLVDQSKISASGLCKTNLAPINLVPCL